MGKEGTPLFAFAEVFDPTFEDLVEPYGPSPADGDPLEDGLSVPVGVDPATRVTAVVALHSSPGQDQIVLPRTLHTTGLPEGFGLGEGTQRLATACEAGSVCVRGPGISWRARRDLCVRPGQPPGDGVGWAGPPPARTQTCERKGDAIDALQAATLLTNGRPRVARPPRSACSTPRAAPDYAGQSAHAPAPRDSRPAAPSAAPGALAGGVQPAPAAGRVWPLRPCRSRAGAADGAHYPGPAARRRHRVLQPAAGGTQLSLDLVDPILWAPGAPHPRPAGAGGRPAPSR
jgi:hypothetical protein